MVAIATAVDRIVNGRLHFLSSDSVLHSSGGIFEDFTTLFAYRCFALQGSVVIDTEHHPKQHDEHQHELNRHFPRDLAHVTPPC